jgi:hypothetical protein
MHSNAMQLHKQVVEGSLQKQNDFLCDALCKTPTASDQVAESYDLARATLATKLATMSTKRVVCTF